MISKNGLRYLVIALLTVTILISPSISFSSASSISPYDSGWDHGCDDASISDPTDRYINQDEKGPAYHTDEFMDGYDEGFYDCNEDESDMNDDDTTSKDDNSNSDCTGATVIGGIIGGIIGSIGGPVGVLGGAGGGSGIAKNLCDSAN